MELIYLIVFAISAAILSLLVNSLFLKFSSNLGTRNTDQLVRWAGSSAKPSVGGFSFYIVFLFAFVVQLVWQPLEGTEIEQLGFLAACTLGFLVGLADDAYNTKPILKFTGQFTCGLILYLSNNGITIFPAESINFTFTILWVAGLMNSVNMLDNMDAITSSASLIIISGMAVGLFIVFGDTVLASSDMLLLIGVGGALLGFLYYNWNPARIYMGDTGSMFIGVFLAGMSIRFLWNGSFNPDTIHPVVVQISMVWLFFAVPLADTLTVSLNRMLSGKSPFVGGRDHTTHHLAYLGFKDRHVAVITGSLQIGAIAWGLVVWYNAEAIRAWHFWINISICLAITIALYSTTLLSSQPQKK
jgi:UDP-GlcNAc:undecaprenyl-phosphate/decaprenyl-phosphate GlcNAc-1-phosphate transferase